MKSFVRFCLVSVVLVALAFFCEGLRVNFLAGTDTGTTVRTSTDSLTDPTQSEHSFIKFNTPCLSSPTAEGQTVVRTATGASGNVCRHTRRTDILIGILGSRILTGSVILKRSLPTLRKLRL